MPSRTACPPIPEDFPLLLFIGYVLLISLMKDIQRVFRYHGAEHKCINCIETGLELNVENVRISSKRHKRCGTSFMLIVMVIADKQEQTDGTLYDSQYRIRDNI